MTGFGVGHFSSGKGVFASHGIIKLCDIVIQRVY